MTKEKICYNDLMLSFIGGKMNTEFSLESSAVDDKSSGYIYVLQNPMFPHLVKIGYTTRTVKERVREINSSSGLPDGFVVKFSFLCDDPYSVEQAIHKEFSHRRHSKNREFFEVNVEDVTRFVAYKYIDEKLVNIIRDDLQTEIKGYKDQLNKKDVELADFISEVEVAFDNYVLLSDEELNIVKNEYDEKIADIQSYTFGLESNLIRKAIMIERLELEVENLKNNYTRLEIMNSDAKNKYFELFKYLEKVLPNKSNATMYCPHKYWELQST
ncbi:GIY-YIG nuclease family protein [Photobacterium kagoshimensis]|uniref:GIY-YIG nuclease family protein n=1 Tax=Photobacterium kagoshimensis TaxID=2910242 RepID=UPI003D09A672